MAITEPTKIKLEFKEAVYMYGGDYNQGFEDGKSEGFEEGKVEGYNEGVEFGKATHQRKRELSHIRQMALTRLFHPQASFQ